MSRTARIHVSFGWRRTPAILVAAAALLAPLAVSSSASATTATHRGPSLAHLSHFGSGLGSGSTIGPDGALYVTDGTAGAVKRVDRRTGAVSVYASGLPPRVLGIGGAVDVAFLAGHGYALVTMVGGDFVGGPHIGGAVVGIYRLDLGGHPSPIADIGAWSIAHPPTSGYRLTTGVQYAFVPYRGGFLVTDGHHNRVLQVTLGGEITEVATFTNVGPTGLEVQGGRVWVAQAGPVPHVAETGQILALDRRSEPEVVARGARLLVDVELGPQHQMYALSQGVWDGVMEGSPALPETGRLTRVTSGGGLEPVTDSAGHELVLDRPTSVEFVGRTAYVVSLSGDVYTIDGL
jgi:sugar lactone lactonase YvrE